MPVENCTRVKIAAISGALSLLLGACSEIYYERSDFITSSAGDANASNIAVQMVDPWPRHAANRNIQFNGEKMQGAVKRYRENKVTPPQGLGTSSIEIVPSAAGPAVK